MEGADAPCVSLWGHSFERRLRERYCSTGNCNSAFTTTDYPINVWLLNLPRAWVWKHKPALTSNLAVDPELLGGDGSHLNTLGMARYYRSVRGGAALIEHVYSL